jgi:hypothetical protein
MPGQVGFVVDKVALGQVFPRVLRFSAVNFIPLVLHYKEKRKQLNIFITGLHNKPQGCGASVASAAGPFTKKLCQNFAVLVCMWGIHIYIYHYYIHKVPVILHDNLQRESHKPYGPPSSVTWLQLLRKQMNTGTSTAPTSRNLTTCDISLGSLKLPSTGAGDFVELLLLYIARKSTIFITAVYCLCDPPDLHRIP